MYNKTPFGYRCQGNIWTVKLRFTKARFEELKLSELGIYRITQSGAVIFEASAMIGSQIYHTLKQKLKAGHDANIARINRKYSIVSDELPF